MPRQNGSRATAGVRAVSPASKVIALTLHHEMPYVRECLRAGAKGYVLKRTIVRDLPKDVELWIGGPAAVRYSRVVGRRIHKTVHHFLLVADDPVHGLALSDEDVEVSEVAWVPLPEVSGRLAYADERRLLERVPDLLAETA